MIGELDAGNPHVQFDEGAQETYHSVTRLCPTLPSGTQVMSRTPSAPFVGLAANPSEAAKPIPG
jgi:hypothetical protein